MAVSATPEVWINGVRVACTADALDRAPVVIRGFDIHWGRAEYMDPSVTPSSVVVTLLDTVGTWATRVRNSQALGLPIEIRWRGTRGDGSEFGPVTMFRGRTSHVECRPHTIEASDGRTAWTVKLTCADRVADFGNATAGLEEWPAEKMLDRAIRLRDLGQSAGSGIAQVYFWPGYVDALTAPLDVKDKTALDLLADFFASMGNDAYAYDPDANVIRQAIRLAQPMSVYLATFDDTQGAVMPVASDITVDGQTYPGVGLGGCQLHGAPVLEADPATDINRLECTWKDHGTGYKEHTTTLEGRDPNSPRRVMAWDSWLSYGDGGIDATMRNVWSRAREEGRRPRHPEFTAKPGHTFVSERMARWLLATWENTRPVFISGNLAYQWLMGNEPGYAPIVAPLGGVTRYDPESGWQITLRVHWIYNQNDPAAPATWTSMRQIRTTTTTPSVPWWWALLGRPAPAPVSVGQPTPERDLTWGDPDVVDGYQWHTSVTWGDTRHIPVDRTQVKDILN